MEQKHFNVSLADGLRRIFNPKGASDFSSFETKIQPVIIYPDRCNIVRSIKTTTTGSTTIYTTPAEKDFYLSTVFAAIHANNTADNTAAVVTVTIEGVTRNIIELGKLASSSTLTNMALQYPIPLKIDRNTNIVYTSAFTAGSCSSGAGITGYTQEVSK